MNIRSQPARLPAGRHRLGQRSIRSELFWNGAARAATMGIFVLLLLAALHYAQPVVMPVVLALVFGIVLTPLLTFAQRAGIPHWFTALFLVGGLFAALSYAIVLLAEPVTDWIQKAPQFGAALREKLRFLDGPIAAFDSLRESIAGKPAGEGKKAFDVDIYAMLVQPMLGVLTPALGQLIIFFATLFFFLSGRESLRRRFLTFWGDRKARLDAIRFLNDTEASIVRYFATIAVINVGLGLLLGGFAYLIGLPNPLVWAVLAFILNFMPYIGPAVTIVLLLGVGMMAFESLAYALAAPAFFLAVSIIEGEFVTPGIVGLQLALSPLLVFLAVAFWAWFWGPFGALLAVPLLIIGTVALNHLFPAEVRLPD
ncbi:MAG TPA: AI-2E family transporter [Xanthobacteraceae bacterium]|jgi:predicted PurR-regulated permease PerM